MFLRKIVGSFILTSVIAALVLAATTGDARAQLTGTGGTVTTGTGGSTGSSVLSASDLLVAVSEQPPVVLSTF